MKVRWPYGVIIKVIKVIGTTEPTTVPMLEGPIRTKRPTHTGCQEETESFVIASWTGRPISGSYQNFEGGDVNFIINATREITGVVLYPPSVIGPVTYPITWSIRHPNGLHAWSVDHDTYNRERISYFNGLPPEGDWDFWFAGSVTPIVLSASLLIYYKKV